MDRIIPFGYPTIVGGASGGASVDPTPPSSDDPQPVPVGPYDFSSMVVLSKGIHENTEEFANVRVGKTATANVYVWNTGIFQDLIPVDLTGVKQIKLEGPSYTSDDYVLTADGVSIKDKLTTPGSMNKTISYLNFQDGEVQLGTGQYDYITKDNWNSYAKSKQIVLKYPVHITVYDTAGEIMQEYDTELIA